MRRWLKKLYDHQFLPAVASLNHTPQDRQIAEQWSAWMKQQWHEHGLKALKQQRNLMTEVRQALKQQFGEEHVAVETMNFSRDEWIQINLSINDRVAARNEQQGLIEQPDVIVDRAKMLLDSRDWPDIAAGLAVVTGRRCTELLQTAEFTYSSPYSVWFTGALKRRQEAMALQFEIPTLAPAKQTIAALDVLRQQVNTEGLDLETINRKYSPPVAKACDRYFAELIPQRAGRGNLYTHLFRTIYARIATHWYAPPTVADIEYMAAIQGHFLIQNEQDTTLRRSLASTRHYNDYKIGDGQGNIDGRQGIRLRDPGVQVLQVFQNAAPHLESAPLTEWEEQPMIRPVKRQRPQREISTLRLYQDERDRWLQILDQFEPRGTQQEKMSVLLEWIEQSLQDNTPIHQTPDDLEQLAHLFIEPLQPLRDPEAIRTLCQQEIADLEQDYYPEDYLPQYKQVIAAAIRSGQLPLIDGQTAERTSYTKEGVSYEQRTHYALLFLDDLEHELEGPQADSSPPVTLIDSTQVTPKVDSSPSQAIPATSNTDQKLDALTTVLTQLVQVMQGEQGASQSSPDLEAAQNEMAQNNGHTQPQKAKSPETAIASPAPEPESSPPKKRGRRRGNTSAAAEAKITQAINAIMDYNNAPTRPFEEKWAISSSLLKRLTKSYQGVIQRVLDARADEIERHHQAHGLGGRHNIRHGRAGVTIEQVIQLETE